jgi:3-dehydroquinate synthase
MSRSTVIPVQTTSVRYTVEIGTGLLPLVGSRLDELLHGRLSAGRQRAFVVTSPEIDRLHGAALDAGFATPPAA